MTEKFIPEHIDPFRFAEQDLQLDGLVRYADMPRLNSNLLNKAEAVSANLRFGIDEQGLTYIKGHIKGMLELQCQRCMDPFKYEIIANFALGIVNTLDEANALPEHYEPALAAEGHLALRELIEDELILNLPIIPRHLPEECKVKLLKTDADGQEEKNENPFQILESLKH